MIKRYWSLLKFHGPKGILLAAGRRFVPPRAKCLHVCSALVSGHSGLEVGGPSKIFARGGFMPLYPLVGRLDNCNFSQHTIWEGTLKEGPHFHFDTQHPAGNQYITEAADLGRFSAAKYAFILSSHVLEHVANPLKALREWKRVLADQGSLILVVPHKDGTFDHRRPVTRLSHLIEDFEKGIGDDDLTHVAETLALHDLDIHPGGCDLATLRERSLRNSENRCLHHHVFDTALLVEVLHHVGFQILAVEAILPFHIIVAARKTEFETPPSNDEFLDGSAMCFKRSPFRSDRQQATRKQ